MATFNEILTGRFNRFVQKSFSMKGQTSLPTLSPDLQMAINFNSGVENRYLESWDLFGFAKVQAGTGGVANTVQLRNPAGSNVVAVIMRVNAQVTAGPAADNAFIAIGNYPDQAGTVTLENWGIDPRGRTNPTCVATFGTVAIAPIGNVTATLGLANFPAAGGSADLVPPGLEYPLLPGRSIGLRYNTVNQATSSVFNWRERLLEESERT